MDKRGILAAPILFVIFLGISYVLVSELHEMDLLQSNLVNLQGSLILNRFRTEKQKLDIITFTKIHSYNISKTAQSLDELEQILKQKLIEKFGYDYNLNLSFENNFTKIHLNYTDAITAYPLGLILSSTEQFNIDDLKNEIKSCETVRQDIQTYLQTLILDWGFESLYCFERTCEVKIFLFDSNNAITQMFPHYLNNGKLINCSF